MMLPRAALLALALLGCSDALRTRGNGEECLFADDCASPLICAGRRCRAPCATDRDCANDFHCKPSGTYVADGGVALACLSPEETGYCVHHSDCGPPLACRLDGTCGPQCVTDSDCRTFTPSGALACVDSMPTDVGVVRVCANNPVAATDGGQP
ncbi:MAG: hypothetical protein R3A52_18850 [Polyangiales bacterium]